MVTAFVNSLMMYFEVLMSVITSNFNFEGSEDALNSFRTVISIMIVLNFIVTIFAYGYAGTKTLKTDNKVFAMLMILLPFILSLPGVITIVSGILDGSEYEYIVYAFVPSCGKIVMSVQSTAVIYLAAAFPSICMCAGYVIRSRNRKIKAKIERDIDN